MQCLIADGILWHIICTHNAEIAFYEEKYDLLS